MNYNYDVLKKTEENYTQSLFDIPIQQFEQIQSIGTYPAKKSLIDHIFFESGKAEIISAGIRNAPKASDHAMYSVVFVPKP